MATKHRRPVMTCDSPHIGCWSLWFTESSSRPNLVTILVGVPLTIILSLNECIQKSLEFRRGFHTFQWLSSDFPVHQLSLGWARSPKDWRPCGYSRHHETWRCSQNILTTNQLGSFLKWHLWITSDSPHMHYHFSMRLLEDVVNDQALTLIINQRISVWLFPKNDGYDMSWDSMDWFVGENLNRKPMGFYHQLFWAFLVSIFPSSNSSWGNSILDWIFSGFLWDAIYIYVIYIYMLWDVIYMLWDVMSNDPSGTFSSS